MNIINIFSSFPPELSVFLISMLPVSELRGAIPMAVGVYRLDIFQAYIISVIGNIIPVVIILKYIEPISNYLMSKSKTLNKYFLWFFARTRRNFNHNYEKWGALALIIFVAIPLPMTGGYSGAIAAFIFGIPFWRALLYVSLGVAIAGVIVMGLSLGVWGV